MDLIILALEEVPLVAALDLADAFAVLSGRVRDPDHQLLDDVDRFAVRLAGRLGAHRWDCESERQGPQQRWPHAANSPGARIPCCFSNARTSGRRPRNSMKASSASRLPPRVRIASRKRWAVLLS